MGWRSRKDDGRHFKDEKTIRDSSIESGSDDDINEDSLDEFAEEKKEELIDLGLHKNADLVNKLMAETNDDDGFSGSRWLTRDGIFSEEGGSHEDVIEPFKKHLDMRPYDENEPDMGNEFLDKTGMVRTMIDPYGKFGRKQMYFQFRRKATPAQIKVVRDFIVNSDLDHSSQIVVDEGIDNNYKELYRQLGYHPFG